MIKHVRSVLLGAALVFGAGTASAEAFGTLTFDQPTGVALSNQSIPVFLTLTIDPGSVAVTTGPTGQVTSGLTDADIAAHGYDPTVYTNRIVNNSFECSGTFTAGCGSTTSGAYHFEFNFTPPTLVGPANFDLEPGQSLSYLFGTFVPNSGNAPAGLYTFYNASAIFEITSADFSQFQFLNFANTCSGQNPACAFTRVVTAAPAGAVPEPATWALLTMGFGAVGAVLRRRASLPVLAA